jgi:uncharacterized protein
MDKPVKEHPEKRVFGGSVEFRENVDENGQKTPVIEGYAAVFDQETVICGLFREVVRAGFFTPALQESHDVRAVVDHEGGLQVLGRTKNGTLKLEEDAKGLRVTINPPDTAAGRDIVELLRRGDLDQMSFAFTVAEQRWVDAGDDSQLDLRELLKVKRLYDASIVTYPAYEGTSVGVRSAEQILSEKPKPIPCFKTGPAIRLIQVLEAEE